MVQTSKKIAMHARAGIYIAKAKIGKPVYWARRILGLEYERTGKKIARLYEKYGNIVVEENPGGSQYAYCIAARYAPEWKARLMEKKESVFEK